MDGVLKSHRRKVVSVEDVTISCWEGWVQVCVSSWSCPAIEHKPDKSNGHGASISVLPNYRNSNSSVRKNFGQTNFEDSSKIFPGQITVFKDYDLLNKSAFFNPLLNTLLAKTRHGVIYDFYFFSHGWAHYFILLSAKRFEKMIGYRLQLHLRYRNSI